MSYQNNAQIVITGVHEQEIKYFTGIKTLSTSKLLLLKLIL